MQEKKDKDITVNRKARHEYAVIDTFEAGISLQGTEVKSMRDGKANLTDAYAQVKGGEVWLVNAHVSEYGHGNINNHNPLRRRKLLLHRSEIRKLEKAVNEKGNTLVPLKMYFTRGKVKVQLAIAKGKKIYDKRKDIALKDMKREMERKIKL